VRSAQGSREAPSRRCAHPGRQEADPSLPQKSLATKDRREATRRAPHALAAIDRTLREAETLVKQPTPKAALRANLTDTEIKRMAEYVYAKALAWDQRTRYGRDELKRMEAEHIRLEGRPLNGPWAITPDNVDEHFRIEYAMPSELVQLTSPSRRTPDNPKVIKLRSRSTAFWEF
jgi:hypothetical protein